MAESASLHDFLQCSICLERFTHPKMLPCQHTYCLSCLRGITKDAKTLDCPLCSEYHLIPDGGVASFKDNLLAKNLLGVVAESEPCFECGRTLSLSTCQHCQEDVCADCRLSHTKLLAEIETYLKWADGAFKTDTDSETSDWWETLLGQIASEKMKVQDVFENVNEKIKNRKKEITAFLNMLETRSLFIVNPSKSQALYQEIVDCKTSEELKEMKLQLTNTDDTLWRVRGDESDFSIQYDVSCIDTFGHLQDGCTVINIKYDPSDVTSSNESREDGMPTQTKSFPPEKSSSSCSTSLKSSKKGKSLLDGFFPPRNVDYQAKNTHVKISIDHHVDADVDKKLIPGFAVYSKSSNDFYLTSEGAVLVYPLGGGEGRKLSPVITNARHVAVSESGCKLVIAEGPVVTIVDLEASRNLDSALPQIVSFRNISNAVQVCCHGNEFAVIDADKKCVMTFSEDGKFIREFGADKLVITENSRMCVDREGRIYVTRDEGVVDREESEDVYCPTCRISKSTIVVVKYVMVVLSWEGDFVEEIEIGGDWSTTYDYTFKGPKCEHGNPSRDEKSVPEDEQIIRENLIRGICVDADGYISITMSGIDQIAVYNPKREPHCTIGDPKKRPGEFKEPSGVNLMPDGRLIVCDTGNNRIQII